MLKASMSTLLQASYNIAPLMGVQLSACVACLAAWTTLLSVPAMSASVGQLGFQEMTCNSGTAGDAHCEEATP